MTDTGSAGEPSTSPPPTASTSSTNTAPSSDRDATVALGERILAELGDPRTNNTLVRWLSHHTARLITEAEQAREAAAPDADDRDLAARDAILELWGARTNWRAGWPPKHAAEMARLLDELPPLDDPQAWVRPSRLGQLHTIHLHVLSTLLDLASPAPANPNGADDGRGTPGPDPSSPQPDTADGEGSIEADWLDQFGEHLTEDEIVLLGWITRRPRRMDALHTWWMGEENIDTDTHTGEEADSAHLGEDPALSSSRSDEPDDDTGTPVGLDGGTEANPVADEIYEIEHPVLDMLDAYRQVLVELFEASAARRT